MPHLVSTVSRLSYNEGSEGLPPASEGFGGGHASLLPTDHGLSDDVRTGQSSFAERGSAVRSDSALDVGSASVARL